MQLEKLKNVELEKKTVKGVLQAWDKKMIIFFIKEKVCGWNVELGVLYTARVKYDFSNLTFFGHFCKINFTVHWIKNNWSTDVTL